MNTNDMIILVDPNDNEIGFAEKNFAHEKGLCHRAFSIFIFYTHHGKLELLLQRRHTNKYHSGGLLSNSCCSHPRQGEDLFSAANRRLKEELNISVPLKHVGIFHYCKQVNQHLIENEIDHVFVGFSKTKNISFDESEISEVLWVEIENLKDTLLTQENNYTVWFKEAFEVALKELEENSRLRTP
jgi:isopentenyl-diphosphate delta-isomerase type 1